MCARRWYHAQEQRLLPQVVVCQEAEPEEDEPDGPPGNSSLFYLAPVLFDHELLLHTAQADVHTFIMAKQYVDLFSLADILQSGTLFIIPFCAFFQRLTSGNYLGHIAFAFEKRSFVRDKAVYFDIAI